MKFKPDNFILALIVVVTLAYFFPNFGTKESGFPIDSVASLGVALIFFFYGLKLSPEKLKSGLKNWKLHVLVQLSTFLLFPIIILLFRPLAQNEHFQNIWLGFLFLAALPSTVSSSVVMVSLAKGNVPTAIFNASISGLIGILITPVWMGFFIKQSGNEYELSSIYLKLLFEILLPVVLGLSLQKFLGKYAQKYSAYLTTFDKSVILLIIYKSFAVSFSTGVFSSVKIKDLIFISVATFILFFVVYFVTGLLSKSLNFNREDQITAQFCGTKKSLVHGTVFSKILFPASMPLGIILLPLMIFHAFQLFVVSIIATEMGKKK
ncbi:MAG: bile acid:sodium symporter [Cytophagaceae bacterium]|nr:bile acid:sodium symporter [Cytophagaceae bacterium]